MAHAARHEDKRTSRCGHLPAVGLHDQLARDDVEGFLLIGVVVLLVRKCQALGKRVGVAGLLSGGDDPPGCALAVHAKADSCAGPRGGADVPYLKEKEHAGC